MKKIFMLIIFCILLFSCKKSVDEKKISYDLYNIKRQESKPGDNIYIDSISEFGNYAVVFEDNGETGFFYALNMENTDTPIVEALHIYNVKNVVDKEINSEFIIGWSKDGLKSILLINNYPHAVLDFENKNGYCRTNFPEPYGEWSKNGHNWDDNILDSFKK